MLAYYKKFIHLQKICREFVFMNEIFEIRQLGVCRKAQIDESTAFTFYEFKQGYEFHSYNLPLNYIFFVLEGAIELSCNENKNQINKDEMIFMLRSSSVRGKVLKKVKLYVMYFDTLISSCDRHYFKAFLPDVMKNKYSFSAVNIPVTLRMFVDQTIYFQKNKVDCTHFNIIKHQEFFILLRQFCPREDIIMFLAPLISNSMSFKAKVLEKYMILEGGRVTKLAELVGMGRKTFDKRFREEFGKPPARWIQEEKAKRLRLYLTEPDIKISDAMDKFDFNSPGHFNRFCQQYFNTSPGMIIKEAKELNKREMEKKKVKKQ